MKRLLSTFRQTSCLLLKQHETSSFGIWLVVAILSIRKGYTLDNHGVKVLPFRIDLFRVVSVLLVGMLALAKGSYAQTCNIVTNGTFAGGSTGWTSSGWVFQTSPAVRAFNNTDGASNNDLTQTLTGLNGGPVAHQVTVSFDLIMQQAGSNSTAITQASLQVLLNGVVYATFNNPTPTGAATGKVTVTTANSASISGFDNLPFPGGTTGNSITDAGISLIIPWPTGSPNSAALTFRFNAPYSDNSGNTVGAPGNGQGGDDFGLQNVLTSGNAATAPTVSATTIGVSCSSSTANLNSLLTSTSTGIVWYTGSDHTGTAYATPTAAVEGIYYGFYNNVGCYTSPVAVSAIAGNCVDTDGDGIPDLTDLDDDNDGILDTVETCVSVEASKTGVTAGMTLNAGTGSIANLLNNSEVNDFWYTSNQNIANQTVVQFDFPGAIILTAFEITTSGVSFLTTTATVKIQGWNGTAWVDIVTSLTTGAPSASTYSTSSSVKFPFAANTTAYTKYRAFGISGTTVSSPFVREAYFTAPCNNDLDGDGLASNVDLDSDGDGCSDAIEGGASFFLTNLVSSAIAGGNSGTGFTGTSSSPVTQNLGIAVGSTGIPTIAGTGQAIGTSQNKLQNTACVDSDGDNVPNDIDLDDDNDGILDTVESTTATNGGDGQITYKKWNIAELASSNSFFSSTTQHLNSPAGTLKYGDFPDFTTSAANASGTTSVVFGQLPWVDIPNGGSNPNDGNFAQIEGYINLPCYSNTLAIRTLANGIPASLGAVRETFTTLHLSLDVAGHPTLNTTDLQQVSYQKVNFDGDIVNSSEYTFANSTSGGKWIRFGDAISDGADFYGALIQWNIDGAGWVDIPAAAFSSTATGLLSVCNYTDNDSDGIPNYLDLDSDGDGCSDAIEGGAAFTVANLVSSTLAGGNSGGSYTGTSATPVTQNLGTIVGSTLTTMGVPTVANTGQTVGTSQNKLAQDPNCPVPCSATVAPALSATSKTNTCPTTTIDLSTITATNTPVSSALSWHTGTPATAANRITAITAVAPGTYYAAFFDATANCYSGTAVTPVTATTIACCTTPSVGGTVAFSGTLPLCGLSNGGTLLLSGNVGTVVKWQTSTNGGTTWTDIVNTSTSLAFTNAVNNQQYRAVVNSGAGCLDANSAPTTVTVTATPATPTLGAPTQPTCSVATGSFSISNYSAANTYTISPSTGVTQNGGTITAPAGTYTVQATLSGCSSGVSSGVTLTTAVCLPTIAITTPKNVTTTSTNPPISGTATALASVTVNGPNSQTCITTADASGAWTCSSLTFTVGSQTVTAVASNTAGTSPTATTSFTVVAPLDSDSDGIADSNDLDDDNDGITDVLEECFGFRAQNTTGAWLGDTPSTVTFAYTGAVTQTTVATLSDSQINYNVNQSGGQQRMAKSSDVDFTITFSPAVPANEIAFYIEDVDPSIASGSPTADYKFLINSASPNAKFVSTTYGGTDPYLAYNPANGDLSLPDLTNNQRVLLKGNTTDLVSTITVTSTGLGAGDLIAYSIFAKKACDTDGDGIANKIDLDSDGDGCPDALEGGAAFANANLASSMMAGGSTNVTRNLGTTVGSTSATMGVPTIAGTGQTIGTSQNATAQDVACAPPTITITSPVNVTTTSTNPPISGTATALASVTVNGPNSQTCITTADASGAWTCSSLTFTVGSQTVTAVASTIGGTSTVATTSFTVVSLCTNPSAGGSAAYAGGPLCPTSNGGTVTLSGQSGTVVNWQTSFDGGANWTDIASTAGRKQYTFYNAVNNQQFRAVVNSGTGCVDANSSPAIISTSNAACSSPTCDKTEGTVAFGVTPAVSGTNFSSVMVLTNTLGVIQIVSAPGSATLTNVVSGDYFVYQVTYDNTVTPLPTITTGLNLSAIGGSCVAISNQLVIKVCPALLPPVATPDIANTNVNTPVTGNVLTNDTDPNAGVLTASLLNQPTSGTVTMSPDGSYTYTPPTGFTGVVSFCYSATNTAGLSSSACVTVNVLPAPSPLVNNPPIATNDNTKTTAGVSVTIAVLANDTDPDSATTLNGQLSNPAIISQPSVGVAVVNNGTIIYTPPANFTGVVTFPYQVCDKATTPLCTTALVTVDVQPTPPVGTTLSPVAVDDALITAINTPKTGSVSTNDSDPNSPALPLTYAPGQPTSGTVVMSQTGSYTYTPATGFSGPTSFTYSVCNTAGKCDVATVSVVVQPANHVTLLPKVWLQGALFGVTAPTGIMRDDLRVKNLIPPSSPYSSWTSITPVGPISNTATVFGVTGNDAIVDWVFVELRSPSNFSAIVDSRPALVQRDGDIVEIDGLSPIAFSAAQGSYYVSVKHRNHLGVMTATAIPLSVTGTSVDFRTPATPTYRITTSAINVSQVTVAQGVALWAGNVVYDRSVIYQGTTNDVSAISNQVKGPLNIAGNASYILNGYYTGDVNLDGRTIYQGNSNDVNYIYLNVTKNHPGNTTAEKFFVIPEQLP